MAASWWIFRDAAGLVGHRHAGRQASRDGVVEVLPLQDVEHLPARAGVHGSRRAIRSISTISARAVVELLRPAAKALPSSTPRRTIIPPAPMPSTVALDVRRAQPLNQQVVAKFELTVIIGSHSSTSVIVCPTRL